MNVIFETHLVILFFANRTHFNIYWFNISTIQVYPRAKLFVLYRVYEANSFFYYLEIDWPENIRLQGGKNTVIYVCFLNTHSGPQLPGDTIWDNGNFFNTVSTIVRVTVIFFPIWCGRGQNNMR